MTLASATTARDELLSTFKVAWDNDVASQDVPVLWRDKEQDIPDSGDWARVTMTHVTGEQVTLTSDTGGRRFRHFGFVTVQIFTDRNEGLQTSDALAQIAKRAFMGVTTANGITFRNVRGPIEIGPDTKWFNVNVVADFEYDEVI